MSSDNQLQNLVSQFQKALRDHAKLWLVPMVVCGGLGTVFAFFKTSTWSAWQTIHVRDDTSVPGQLANVDSRTAAQETVFELARNRSVIAAALKNIGPPKSYRRPDQWPTKDDITAVREHLSVSAPSGSELGKADVIQLSVEADSPEAALRLNSEICKQLDIHLQTLRMAKAENLVAELESKRDLAEKELELATAELKQVERQIGQDLGELRTLDQTGSGESNLRSSVTQISNDLRAAKKRRMAQQQLKNILNDAQVDATKLISIPDRLLDSQPELRKLKDGLASAQLNIAELQGKMSDSHPQVRAAVRECDEIRSQITQRLPESMAGVQADIHVTDGLVASLNSELSAVQGRLSDLASLRAPYSNLVNRVQNRRDQLKEANQALSRERAQQSSSKVASVFTRVGEPEVSDSPIGPGRVTI
ncbi:MAG: hypothetical protein KDB27_10755, partial [Planctomycetales bacterium]|nr:hypothetical protein [Planctomycetales bacterium]